MKQKSRKLIHCPYGNPECPICKKKDLTDGDYCLEDGIFVKPEGVGEWEEKLLIIRKSNGTGNFNCNFEELSGFISTLLLQEKAKWRVEGMKEVEEPELREETKSYSYIRGLKKGFNTGLSEVLTLIDKL